VFFVFPFFELTDLLTCHVALNIRQETNGFRIDHNLFFPVSLIFLALHRETLWTPFVTATYQNRRLIAKRAVLCPVVLPDGNWHVLRHYHAASSSHVSLLWWMTNNVSDDCAIRLKVLIATETVSKFSLDNARARIWIPESLRLATPSRPFWNYTIREDIGSEQRYSSATPDLVTGRRDHLWVPVVLSRDTTWLRAGLESVNIDTLQ
jgi:hypothetical protein